MYPVIAAIMFVGGMVLFVLGLRGRPVNDHPHCAACGFDLTGRYPEAPQCPECGEPIDEPRHIRTGRRERRRGMMLCGGGLLSIVMVFSGGAIWLAVRGSNIYAAMPTWLLSTQLDFVDASTAGDILDELSVRLGANQLTQGQIDELVRAGLALQGDLGSTWVPEWGDFIEEGYMRGKVAKEDIATYGEQLIVYEFRTRKHVRSGEAWPLWWEQLEIRGGSGYRDYVLRVSAIEIRRGEDVVETRTVRPHEFMSNTGREPISSGFALPVPLPPHPSETLYLTLDTSVITPGRGYLTFARWRETIDTGAVVIPRDAEEVMMIDDPSLRDAITQAIEIDITCRTFDAVRFIFDVRFDDPPANVAFEVFALIGGKEYEVGTVAAAAGSSTSQHLYLQLPIESMPDNIEETGMTFIFRPSAEAAHETVDIYKIWDGEVIIEDVPVKILVSIHRRRR